MSATIIDGTRVANNVRTQTRQRAVQVESTIGLKPCLVTILIGEDPVSRTYVRNEDQPMPCHGSGLAQPSPARDDDNE